MVRATNDPSSTKALLDSTIIAEGAVLPLERVNNIDAILTKKYIDSCVLEDAIKSIDITNTGTNTGTQPVKAWEYNELPEQGTETRQAVEDEDNKAYVE